MELFELGQLAMQAVHLGRPAEALRIADEVIESQPSSSRVAAVFRIRRARAIGQTGDRPRALAEHDRAAAILTSDASAADPAWTWWVDDAELAWHRAMTLAALHRLAPALDMFQAAHDLRPPSATRARFNDLVHLLDAQVAAGAWSDAEASLDGIHAGLDDVHSARTTALLRRVIQHVRQATAVPSSVTDSAHELDRLVGSPA